MRRDKIKVVNKVVTNGCTYITTLIFMCDILFGEILRAI